MKIKGLYQKRGWWYYQPPMSGGKRPPAIALKTEDEAAAVSQAFKLYTKNALHSQTKGRMEDMIDAWLKARCESGQHTMKTAFEAKRTLVALSKEWGNPLVSAITRARIEAWRKDLKTRAGKKEGSKMSDASIGSYLRRLRGFLSWLVDQKFIREHPMAGFYLGRVKRTRREEFCTVEQREVLISGVECFEHDLILHLGFFAGLRFGEMLAMDRDWLTVAGEKLILTVQATEHWKPKDKEVRSIEVHPRLKDCLHRGGNHAGYVLAPYKKVWKDPPAFRFNPKKSFKAYLEKKGMAWASFHTLRHSFATHLALAGVPMVEIAGLLGDSLRVTEETYVGYSPATKSGIGKI